MRIENALCLAAAVSDINTAMSGGHLYLEFGTKSIVFPWGTCQYGSIGLDMVHGKGADLDGKCEHSS